MNRPMFLDVENVGIMQGFKDADDGMGMEGGEYDTGAMLERTPSSPEILMNNLRGDMRSVDARMEELAQLVGEEAAMDTPAEVLALLQPVLASQEGIGSLPAGMPDQSMGSPTPPPSPMGDAMPAPDMGMMPPDMGMMPQDMMPVDVPPGPPPTAQAPLQMAEGGFVQRFRDGSDEEGVTPVDEQNPPMPVDPASARAMMMNIRNQQAAMLPSLEQEMQSILPVYERALGGGDRSMTQSQILFDIAQAGLNLAAGTDAQGKPVRPGASFASSLAAAAQGVPERIASRVGQMEQQEQGIKLAALKSAESSVEAQRKTFAELMKGEASPFGKGAWEWNIINRPELLDRWSRGEVTPEEETQVQSAIAKLTQPRTEYYSDPLTGEVKSRTVIPNIPPFVTEAMNKKGVAPPTARPDPSVSGRDSLSTEITDASSAQDVPVPVLALNLGQLAAPGTTLDSYGAPGVETFFTAAAKATGPFNVTKRTVDALPILGDIFPAGQEVSANAFMQGGINAVAKSLAETERFGMIEKATIIEQLGLLPQFMDRPNNLRANIVGLDNLLLQSIVAMNEAAMDTSLPIDRRKQELQKIEQIRQVRQILGAPPRVYNLEDRARIAPGQPFIYKNQIHWVNM